MSTTPDAPRMRGTMDLFADLTGGRALRNTNDLLAGVKAAAEDMRGTYSVGFYAPQESDERWHTFTVKVRRPGVKVVHRQGYLSSAATKQSELWLADQWRAAANNPLGSATVRLDARFELKGDTLSAVIQIPAEDLSYRPLNGTTACTLEIAHRRAHTAGAARHPPRGRVVRVEGGAGEGSDRGDRAVSEAMDDRPENLADSRRHSRSLHRTLRHAGCAGGGAAVTRDNEKRRTKTE